MNIFLGKGKTNMITRFAAEYEFLSNFHNCPVMYEGMMFENSEAAFQAAKCTDANERIAFTHLTGAQAKKFGRKVTLRPDWDEVKLDVMYAVVKDKFCRNKELVAKLLATGDEEIREGNYWHDKYWGVDIRSGAGENHLGKILMMVRQEIAEKEDM